MKPYSIIAEIGSTHDGNLNIALKSIRTAAKCGADIIKFQMHISEHETLKNAPNPPFFKNEKRYDYFKRTSFSIKNWKKIIRECKLNKVDFLCTPFSLRAVEILETLNVKAYKIASGEVTNLPLLKKINNTGKFTLISTGMSNFNEIDNAIKIFKNKKRICLMQCTSIYPCPDKFIGINLYDEFSKRYKIEIGFSDHTNDNLASICFASKGSKFIEKHFTLSKKFYGSDAKYAMEPKEFKVYCEKLKRVWKIHKMKVDKNDIKKFKLMKKVFEKSIVSRSTLKKNHKIKFKDLAFLKPGTGIRADKYSEIIGLRTKKNIKKLKLIKISDLKK